MHYPSDGEWHKLLIEVIAARMRPECFLELGLAGNPTLLNVARYCKSLHGVDIAQPATFVIPSSAKIHMMSTDDFFAGPGKSLRPDLVLVDADHRSAQVRKDLEGVARIAAENCVVLIHDTFPESHQFVADGYCSDSYKVPGEMSWEHVTLPCPPGVTICRMRPRSLV